MYVNSNTLYITQACFFLKMYVENGRIVKQVLFKKDVLIFMYLSKLSLTLMKLKEQW